MPSSKIIAVYEPPPIPVRWFDWYAYREGTCDNCGHGSTREAAIVHLKELEAEAEFLLLGRTDGGEVDIDAGRC